MKQMVLSRLVLGLMLSCLPATRSQVEITWNGTTVTGPVLIYHDEISVNTGPYREYYQSSQLNTTGPGALVCRHEREGTVHWRIVDNITVVTVNNGGANGDFRQLRTGLGFVPSLSSLIVTRDGVNRNEVNVNGLWPCLLVTSQGIEGSAYVGIYHRGGGGRGPMIQSNNVSIGSSDPQTFTLFGDTSGGPPTTYTWTRDGVSISNGGSFSISIGVNLNPRNGLSPLVDSTYRSTLTVTGRLSGVYQYSVSNRATPTMVTSSINIPPTDITSSSLNATSVSISWTQPESSWLVDEYRVNLTLIERGSCTSIQDRRNYATTSTSFVINNLQESFTYSITITVVNASGVTNNAIIDITQPEASPTQAPQDVMTSITSRSISATWSTITCIERNGEIIGYAIEFGPSGGATVIMQDTTLSFTRNRLTPFTNYTFRVAGVNSAGTGVYSDLITITTDEDAPGPVFNLTTAIGFFSIVFTWSLPQEPNGVIISYEVNYTVNDSNPVTVNVTALNTTFTISSLTPGTRVSATVSAYTSAGKGAAADLTDISTLTIQSIVVNITVMILSDTSVLVSWDRLPIPEITGYIVHYSQTGQSSEQSVTVSGSENSVVISGLATNTEYQFEVMAVAEVNGNIFIGRQSVTTKLIVTSLSGSRGAYTRDISIAVVVTFLLVTIPYTIILILLVCYICHINQLNKKDVDAVNMSECAAYGQVSSKQTSLEATKPTQTEGVYETVAK